MSTLRQRIRETVPFSGPLYARGEHYLKQREGRRAVQQLRDSGTPIWLDIGGGARSGAGGWATLDVTRECDIYWDLRRGLPFPDDSVDRIYSSHLFEHLSYTEGQALMRECLRALKPGATFSICVPNARLYLEAYVNGKQLPDEWFGWEPANNHSSRIDMVNYVAYLDGHHRCMFDESELVARLVDVGFADVQLRGFDAETDLLERDYESIYAIGSKPGCPGPSSPGNGS